MDAAELGVLRQVLAVQVLLFNWHKLEKLSSNYNITIILSLKKMVREGAQAHIGDLVTLFPYATEKAALSPCPADDITPHPASLRMSHCPPDPLAMLLRLPGLPLSSLPPLASPLLSPLLQPLQGHCCTKGSRPS